MEEIRNIKGKKEEAAFSELSTYCFPDMNGWTKRIFPLQSGDIAWGMFENNSLSSAVISKPFYVYIFNTITKMAGIVLFWVNEHSLPPM